MPGTSRRIIEKTIEEDLRLVEQEMGLFLFNNNISEFDLIEQTIKIFLDSKGDLRVYNRIFDKDSSEIIGDYPLEFWSTYGGDLFSSDLKSKIRNDVTWIKHSIGEYIGDHASEVIGKDIKELGLPPKLLTTEYIISSVIYSNETLIIEIYDKKTKKTTEIYLKFRDMNVNQVLGLIKNIVKDENYCW